MSTQLTPYIDSDIARKAAQAWAKAHGYHGSTGGWIYDSHHRPVAQGWFNFEAKYYASIRDWVTAQVTAFDSFRDLVNTDERYRPTLLVRRGWRERYLADSFDLWCYQLGQSRRAWRGSGRVHQGAPCVCGHTVEQHAVRCEAQDVICGCVRFRVVG